MGNKVILDDDHFLKGGILTIITGCNYTEISLLAQCFILRKSEYAQHGAGDREELLAVTDEGPFSDLPSESFSRYRVFVFLVCLREATAAI